MNKERLKGKPGEVNGGHRSYDLVLSLVGAKPVMEWHLSMANEYTLAELHEVIQVILGWSDRYEHVFETREGQRFRALNSDSLSLADWALMDAAGIRLRELRDFLDEKIAYYYGQHGQWIVTIKRLRTHAVSGAILPPVLESEALETPPEQCEDWADYEDLQEALLDQNNARHARARTLLNRASLFDRDQVNEILESIFEFEDDF